MIAIRGATTIDFDSAEQIKERVGELLAEMAERNALKDGQLVCLIFSNTSDIHSFYPAKAAREAGFYACPIFSALEPEIDGALKLCIRVMALAETSSPAVHIYLHGAKNLRKDISGKFNVAIDGPAGSGKSTISKILGKKLNILCLDTGAMYRACALKCLQSGAKDEQSVQKIMEKIDLKVEYKDGRQVTVLDGKDVSNDIRTADISMLASKISAYACVREKMVAMQREIASATSCILDGRDIGTNVLPNAQFKFFLTASDKVRAERRFKEDKEKGYNPDFGEILKDIIKRDEQDRTRAIAPLKKAADAIEVDTSGMTVEEVVSFIENKIQEKI